MKDEERRLKLAAIEKTITYGAEDTFWIDQRKVSAPRDKRIFLVVLTNGIFSVTVGLWNSQLDRFLTHLGAFQPVAVQYWAEIPEVQMK